MKDYGRIRERATQSNSHLVNKKMKTLNLTEEASIKTLRTYEEDQKNCHPSCKSVLYVYSRLGAQEKHGKNSIKREYSQ